MSGLSLRGVVACAVLMSGLAAAAEPCALHLGEMELVCDAARWRVEPAGENSVTLQPVGDAARKLDPVMVDRGPGDQRECERLARRRFADRFYEEATTPTAETRRQTGSPPHRTHTQSERHVPGHGDLRGASRQRLPTLGNETGLAEWQAQSLLGHRSTAGAGSRNPVSAVALFGGGKLA
jgi:hypothetical protein